MGHKKDFYIHDSKIGEEYRSLFILSKNKKIVVVEKMLNESIDKTVDMTIMK